MNPIRIDNVVINLDHVKRINRDTDGRIVLWFLDGSSATFHGTAADAAWDRFADLAQQGYEREIRECGEQR